MENGPAWGRNGPGGAANARLREAPMSRILRNYLISFVIIGLFFLAVHLINRAVEERAGEGADTREAGRAPASQNQGR